MRILLNLQNRLDQLIDRARTEERGDVPGWVLVALMSAGIVILLWTVAGPLLSQVFEDAVNRVTANF
ncbi:hypothetical protein [Gulosibacter molinativorax]|uniref:Pilus assembly protein n=1 Tax=Gulosibacter molinativorax TaxID=256821 RepID=A0ABT7CBH9_9MICO|nr:hypothetical protein [Gulosibacter molinativorax]MDJ1372499.1 hypothetical protein [Gulosibacter molinativorax]QUY61923.1 Conserved membrane protein [Gulosibacter molinativorax]